MLGNLDATGLNETLAMIAGTSSCHMAASPDPRQIPGVWGPYYDAMLPGYWLNEGGQSATGSLLDHILDLHAEGRPLGADRHAVMAAQIEAALTESGFTFVEDLHVLPDFHGNRSPLADPESVGVIHGLRLDASPTSLTRLYFATAVGIAPGNTAHHRCPERRRLRYRANSPDRWSRCEPAAGPTLRRCHRCPNFPARTTRRRAVGNRMCRGSRLWTLSIGYGGCGSNDPDRSNRAARPCGARILRPALPRVFTDARASPGIVAARVTGSKMQEPSASH